MVDALPRMNKKERLEMLDKLNDIYVLNQEEDQVIQKIKDGWEKPEAK